MDESPLLCTTDDSTVFSSTSPSSGTNEHVTLLSPLISSPDNGTSATNTSSSSYVLTPDSGIEESDDCVEETKTKHRKNQPPDGNLLPPCRVCGEKASGLHYGANTCEPCKVRYLNMFENL